MGEVRIGVATDGGSTLVLGEFESAEDPRGDSVAVHISNEGLAVYPQERFGGVYRRSIEKSDLILSTEEFSRILRMIYECRSSE